VNQATPVCVVTGAATGIGAACAKLFARQGWNVGLNHFDELTLNQVRQVAANCEAAGSEVLLEPLDVRSDSSCLDFVQEVIRRWGRIDALINCAGTTRFISHPKLDELDGAEFHRTYDVNVVGMYQMTRACASALKVARGAIVNLSSIAGAVGMGSSIAYAASKGAVNTLTLSMARVLAPDGVRVNAIAPGMVAQGLSSRLMSAEENARWIDQMEKAAALKRVSQPDEIAQLAWFMVAQSPGMTGQVVALDNGITL
jgi:3-oxoacyl-[acyl-carrier protein] reductase